MSVTVIGPDGQTFEVEPDQVQALADRGFRVMSADDRAAQVAEQSREDYYSTPGQKVSAGIAGAARGATFGLSDALGRAMGAEDDLRALREYNPGTSLATELGGSLLTAKFPAGVASRVVPAAAEGAGVIAKLGRAAGGAAVEGAIYGAGSGVSEMSLSKDPLTFERAASVMSSHTLFGAGVGAGAGLLTKGVEVGLSSTKTALEGIASRANAPELADDLAKLDVKGLRTAERTERESLRVAEKTEVESLKKAETSELEAIEQARVAQRKDVADEIRAFRQEVKDQKHFLTTDGVSLPALEGKASAAELGRTAAKSMRQLDNLLDNPIGLAQNPVRALDALQRHEASTLRLLDRGDELRTIFKADATGTRLAALDSLPAALEQNRALQKKLADLAAKPASSKLEEIALRREALQGGAMKTSPRLDDIIAARDVAAGAGEKGLMQQMLGGSVFGGVASAIGAIPVIGQIPGLASLAGAKAAQFVNGGLQRAITAQAGRTAKAVGMVLDVTKRASRVAPVLATKVLSQVAYAPDAKPVRGGLAPAYKARTDELKRLTQFTPDGRTEMRPEARAEMAKRLDPIRPIAPMLADALETIHARKVEYLSSIMPRRPEVGGISAGPDRWQPSSMEMRAFARSVAAVEDPAAVFERVAGGTVTPEDKDAVRAVYPEMYADFQHQVFAQMPTLRKALPYQKRLALSIFSEMPVDASMHPAVLAVLQASYVNDEPSAGGTMAPTPQPQFGSVKAESPTPAQERNA